MLRLQLSGSPMAIPGHVRSVLDWNEPSIRFYRSLGAVAMDEWTVQRLAGAALEEAAAMFEPAAEQAS